MKVLKEKVIVILVLMLIGATNLPAQGNFEGKISYKITIKGESESVNMDYYAKADMVRVEWPLAEMKTIMIVKDGKRYMIMPEQKMYMEFDQSMDEDMPTEEPENKPVKTGETKTILGNKCEKWIVNSDDNETELWLAEGFGNYLFAGNPMERQKHSWQQGMKETGFFPLLIISKNKKGVEEYKQEVVEINKMKLSEELFTLQPGLQKMTMPSMPVMPQR